MADYGRVAWQQGEAILTVDGKGRVAWVQGEAILTVNGKGRVAWVQGEAIAAPPRDFRVANLFVEVFATLREVPKAVDPIEGGIRRGLDVARTMNSVNRRR